LEFQWTDGIFSVALSKTKPDGYRTAFFHPLASRAEFTVSTQVLRNEKLSERRTHGKDFKFIGQRGPDSQAGNHVYDVETGVMFFAEMQRNAVTCWNIKHPLKGSNLHIVSRNNATMIYPVDLTVN
jgi:dopachrome tautomerase